MILTLLKSLRNKFTRRYSVSFKRWQERQYNDELNFWNSPEKYESLGSYRNFKEKYLTINKGMFKKIRLNFPVGRVLDVGCGPQLGFLPIVKAKIKIGIDPLAKEYEKKYKVDKNILVFAITAEKLPFTSNSIDGIYCVNMLDHTFQPYEILDELYRVLKQNGYLAFAVDVGGTPNHPIKLHKEDLDGWFKKHKFQVIEQHCSDGVISSWPKEMKIPLYVFQGIKA